jgi:hypothetical protein
MASAVRLDLDISPWAQGLATIGGTYQIVRRPNIINRVLLERLSPLFEQLRKIGRNCHLLPDIAHGPEFACCCHPRDREC